jgi:flagellum-specific ATP synthase
VSAPLELLDREAARGHVREACEPFYRGQVEIVSGVLVEAVGVPAAMGELCRIRCGPAAAHGLPQGSPEEIDAEVVGFRGSTTLLMPHGDLHGVAPLQPVIALRRPFAISVGDGLLGRVVDGFGNPLDDGPPLAMHERRSVRAPAPGPLEREPIVEPLRTGVRAIDGFATLGRGQRLGIFSGSGVGKSTLLGQITRGTDADVLVVCLVGERGREVRGFLDDVLGREGLERAVVVVATSDRPPIERFLAPFAAVTIAEHFRDQGRDCLMVMDSVTRFAAAAREIGLAAGEPPTVRGYPPSFFATVPKLVERMGRTTRGSITGLVTVLLDADDPNDPVADTLRGLLDGHLMLSRELAHHGHWPAIDVLSSLSRLMPELCDEVTLSHSARLRGLLATWREGRDLVEIGAYKPGTNPALDEALRLKPALDVLLRQGPHELSPLEETREMLAAVCAQAGGGA